ncbi:MAG: class II aldolase/adducin family protein [Bryobacterales bacterium]|nr:class II aldolase/adducin family protein [Bryobacterales bacterium]
MAPSELQELCDTAGSFHRRGYAFGSTGNLSVRVGPHVWITPTGKPLRDLEPEHLAQIDLQGAPLNGVLPSKEYPFHLLAYESAGPGVAGVVHLHSTHAVALSCLATLDESDPLPLMTPYYRMRVHPLAVLPYFRPGSPELAEAVGRAAEAHHCILLRNHGIVCLGGTIAEAADRAEELEETAKLFFLLRHERLNLLTPDQRDEIDRAFRTGRA